MAKELTYTVTSGSLPAGYRLSENTGKLVGKSTASYTAGGVTSTFEVTASNSGSSTARTFTITRKWYDGSTSALAGTSAEAIKAETGLNTDAAYYISLPTVGPTLIYCRMNSAFDKGGWMMAMKATRGTTFVYTANYWTTNNTLNPSAANTSDGDAKFDTFNYFAAAKIAALWPDIPDNQNSGPGGGKIGTGLGGWTWQEDLERTMPNHRLSDILPPRRTLYDLFGADGRQWTYAANQEGGHANIRQQPNKSGIGPTDGTGPFTSQGGHQWYGFNYQRNAPRAVRWGFAWNNEGDQSSNDCGGGIGLGSSNRSYSAGDANDGAADYGGINRSARVELYVK